MNRFKVGQRVFDKDCGEFGKVLRYVNKQTVEVVYDHDWGCASNVDSANINDFESA